MLPATVKRELSDGIRRPPLRWCPVRPVDRQVETKTEVSIHRALREHARRERDEPRLRRPLGYFGRDVETRDLSEGRRVRLVDAVARANYRVVRVESPAPLTSLAEPLTKLLVVWRSSPRTLDRPEAVVHRLAEREFDGSPVGIAGDPRSRRRLPQPDLLRVELVERVAGIDAKYTAH